MVECKLPKLITRVRFPFLAFVAFSDGKGQKAPTVLRSRNGWSEWLEKNFLILIAVFLLSGCATAKTRKDYIAGGFPEKGRPGVYHKVKRGETLWSIAKA